MGQVRLARQSNRVVRRWPRAQRAMGRLHARLYALSGGRFLPRWYAGAPVMVLETVGRRSGHKRATPVLYLREAGAGEVIVGRRRMRVAPRLLAGAERDRLWRAFIEMHPQAEYYTAFTDRVLALIALEPEPT